VRRITDHLIDHGYHLVDYDGLPTRWGYLSPDALNRDEAWVVERGSGPSPLLLSLRGSPYHRDANIGKPIWNSPGNTAML
jgi:hypothetical protein